MSTAKCNRGLKFKSFTFGGMSNDEGVENETQTYLHPGRD